MISENKELDKIINDKKKEVDNEKLETIINKIDKENSKLASKNKEMLSGINPQQNIRVEVEENEENEVVEEDNEDICKDIEIDIEKFSIINTTKNCFIKLFSFLLPYKNDLNMIKIHYNTTILLTFKIYRFLVLMSFFALFIFFFEIIYHIVKKKDNFFELCKYNLPCFLQYSSFDISEAKVFSITYGIWLIFLSICLLAYYYVLSSDQEKQNIYFENNKNMIGSRYLVTAWNFNYKNEEITNNCKKAINEELKLYAKNFAELLQKNEEEETNYDFIYIILGNILYLVFIFIYFALFFLIFYIRDFIRNKNEVINSLGPKDIFADIISFLIISALFHLFDKLTEIFPRIEGWAFKTHKYVSNVIKKMITTFVGYFSLLFIYTYFTLYTNNLGDKISFFGSTSATFFGCPGLYEDHRHTYHDFQEPILNGNYTEVKSSSYSQCREEEIGFDFLFIFLIYFILIFLIDIFKNCLNCCLDIKQNFDPIKSMMNVFTAIIFYSITMYFIPYLSLLFPLVTIALYKFQFYLLNHKKSYTFNENGLIKRNNTKYLLIIFLIFIIELIGTQGYFYLLSYPHYYKVKCYSPNEGAGEFSILLYGKKWCGPVRSFVRVSDIFTNTVADAPLIGRAIYLLQEMPILIVILALVFIVIIYRKNNIDSRYNEYLKKKQRELDNTFRVYYEQISKRDMLTSMLLKVTKLKV